MRTAIVSMAVTLPMVLFFGVMIAFVEGHISTATVLLSAFAICAFTVTAVVFHGKQAVGSMEDEA